MKQKNTTKPAINEDIIRRALERAVAGGWKDAPLWDEQMGWAYYPTDNGGYAVASVEEIIFDHGFAKAFWGEEEVSISFVDDEATWNLYRSNREVGAAQQHMLVSRWKANLIQMVLKSEPLRYLEQFFEEDEDSEHEEAYKPNEYLKGGEN